MVTRIIFLALFSLSGQLHASNDEDIEYQALSEEIAAEERAPTTFSLYPSLDHLGYYLLTVRTIISGVNFVLVSRYMHEITPETTPQKDLISKIAFHFVGGISIATKGNWLGATAQSAFCFLTMAGAYAQANHYSIVRERLYYWLSAMVTVASFAASVANVEVIKILRNIENEIPFTSQATLTFYDDLYTLAATIVACQTLLVVLDIPFSSLTMQHLFGYHWHPDDAKRSIFYRSFQGELLYDRN